MGLEGSQLMALLMARYREEEWAFFPEVGNATGILKCRSADAVALNLWPSRGLELHGFEIKASRSDWTRERDCPAKAEAVCKYCDRWWLVVGDGAIVAEGELPPTWGLMVPKGKKLAVAVQAPKLEAQPLSRSFIAALMKKAREWVAPKFVPVISTIGTEEWRAAYDKGVEDGGRRHEHAIQNLNAELEHALDAIAEFQKASGLDITHWRAGKIGEAVAALMDRQTVEEAIRQIEQSMQRSVRDARHLKEELRALLEFSRRNSQAEEGVA